MTRDDWLYLAYFAMLVGHAINVAYGASIISGFAGAIGVGVLLHRIGVPK